MAENLADVESYPWSIKESRPDSVPECQNVSSLPHLPDEESSCSGNGSRDKCFYFRCTTCMPFLALDHYNRDHEHKIEFIPRIDSMKPKFGLFKEDSGYVGEVIDFYGAYLSQIDGLNGIAVNSWKSENADLFFNGIDKTFEGTNFAGSKNFEIDWILFMGNTLNVIEVGRRNISDKQSNVAEQSCLNEGNVSKGTRKLVKEKIEQAIKDQIIIEKLLAVTKCEVLQVNYFVFLPTIPVEDVQLENHKELLSQLAPTAKL